MGSSGHIDELKARCIRPIGLASERTVKICLDLRQYVAWG